VETGIVYPVEDVIVPEADDGPAVLLEGVGSLLVIMNCRVIGVLRAVDLDDEFVLRACEIDDIAEEGQLSSEAEAVQPVSAQAVPKF